MAIGLSERTHRTNLVCGRKKTTKDAGVSETLALILPLAFVVVAAYPRSRVSSSLLLPCYCCCCCCFCRLLGCSFFLFPFPMAAADHTVFVTVAPSAQLHLLKDFKKSGSNTDLRDQYSLSFSSCSSRHHLFCFRPPLLLCFDLLATAAAPDDAEDSVKESFGKFISRSIITWIYDSLSQWHVVVLAALLVHAAL